MLNIKDLARPDHPSFTKRDITELLFDFRFASIFFETPLTIEILGNTINVGEGLGAISHTLFERAQGCTMCGRCCHTKERANWQWWQHEEKPDGLIPVDFRVNGQLDQMFVYKNTTTPYDKCGFLVPLTPDPVTNEPREGCSLHLVNNENTHGYGIKPGHCQYEFMTCVKPVNTVFGIVHMLSRRMPGRNWRSPQCPVDVAKLPITPAQIDEDHFFWRKWVASWGHWPGSHIERGYDLWQKETLRRQVEGPNPAKDYANIYLFSTVDRPMFSRSNGPTQLPVLDIGWTGERQPPMTRAERLIQIETGASS